MRKRAAGPVHFGSEEDDLDDDDVSQENFASQFEEPVDQDTE
jgi:hypothetical protein